MLYMNLLLQSFDSYEFMSPFSFGGSLGTWKLSVSLVAHRLSVSTVCGNGLHGILFHTWAILAPCKLFLCELWGL